MLAFETTQSRVELRCAIDGSMMSYGARIRPNSVPSYISVLSVISKRKSAHLPEMSSGADVRGRRFCGGFGPR